MGALLVCFVPILAIASLCRARGGEGDVIGEGYGEGGWGGYRGGWIREKGEKRDEKRTIPPQLAPPHP